MKKQKFSVALDASMLARARSYVYRTPGMTLARLTRVGVEVILAKAQPRISRKRSLRRGRKADPFPKALTPEVFYRRSGFEKQLAQEIARRYNLLTAH